MTTFFKAPNQTLDILNARISELEEAATLDQTLDKLDHVIASAVTPTEQQSLQNLERIMEACIGKFEDSQ